MNLNKKANPIIRTSTKLIAAIIVIIVIAEFSFSAKYSWAGLIPLLAMFGGMIVFLGLWIENEADEEIKREHISNFTGHQLRAKIKAVCGWRILMFGIALEIGISGVLAAIDVHENMTMNNAITAADPRNWPISEMNAVAWFTVQGTNMDDELTNLLSGRKAQMTIWKNEREGFSLDALEAGNGDIEGRVLRPIFGLVDRRVYRVSLHSFNFLTAEGINPPLGKTIDDMHLVHVDLNFLPRDSQISSGRVILTVNNVTKYFDVPNQNDTNSNMGWQNDFQCWFVATNGVQSSEKQFLYLHD